MCGFAAMISTDGTRADPRVVARMTSIIRHRGPDGEGAYAEGSVAIGFRRLAILDLRPAADQPMASPDGQVVLVFNGEIYNYVELGEELRSLGHTSASTGDTEVLLHAYLQWGPRCLERLNGMWAFLVYDRRRRVLFGSRDHFGKKPYYYYRSGPYFLIGSEIKAIVASGLYRGGVNWAKAGRLLLGDSLDHVPEDAQTFYSQIQQLPAGSAFELDLQGGFRTWRYWSIPQAPENGELEQEPAPKWADLFEDAVRIRLRADVPVGLFLSGGMDSTSIACAAARLRKRSGETGEPILAFSFQSPEHDESRYLRDTLSQTGIEIVPFRPDPQELVAKLEQCLWFQDEPLHSLVGLISFELSRLAAERGVKVILIGAGADEYLAGYPTYFENYWWTLLTKRGAREARREIEAYCRMVPGDPRALLRRVRLVQLFVRLGRIAAYRKLTAWLRARRRARHPWFTPALFDSMPAEEVAARADHGLHAALRTSVESAPLPLYLRIDDRNSMAHSIEARAPFLDHRLVERAFALPPEWKLRDAWNKYLLREAMRDRIPESVRTRVDKMGFPVPARTWFAGPLQERILDTVQSREFRERGIYRVPAIERDIEAHRQGKVDISKQLFNLIQFEIWSDGLRDSIRSAAVA